MSYITDACAAKQTTKDKTTLSKLITWIAGREFYRAQGNTFAMDQWDERCGTSTDQTPTVYDTALAKFLGSLASAVAGYLPGWNNDDCSFDALGFACFSYWLAQQPDDVQAGVFAQLAAGSAPSQAWSCSPDVTADLTYDALNAAAPSKKKYLLAVIGIAGIAMGAVAVHMLRVDKQDGPLSNPVRADRPASGKGQYDELMEQAFAEGLDGDPGRAKDLYDHASRVLQSERRSNPEADRVSHPTYAEFLAVVKG